MIIPGTFKRASKNALTRNRGERKREIDERERNWDFWGLKAEVVDVRQGMVFASVWIQ